MFKTKEKYSTAKRLYATILKLIMLYDSYIIFDAKDSKLLSEGDYLVKV
jgi:hypothetical protein